MTVPPESTEVQDYFSGGERGAALAVAADGRTVALGTGGVVRLYSLPDWTLAQSLSSILSDSGQTVALAISPDRTLLATASGRYPGQEVTLHDTATGQARLRLSLGHSPFHFPGHDCLAFSPDGRTLAVGWGEPMVRLWDTASGEELPAPPGDSEHVTAVAFSPDGKTLAAALDEWAPGNLRLWDFPTNGEKASFEGPAGALAFSPDSRLLATAGGDGFLRLRSAVDGRLLGTFLWHQDEIDAVAFSPDGRWLATGAKEDRVKLWPVDGLLS